MVSIGDGPQAEPVASRRLVVVGGLPGVGKTTVSRQLARALGATYLRVDAVEVPLFSARQPVGPLGYEIVDGLARGNLRLGNDVVVDLVNPLPLTRAMWRRCATEEEASLHVFECYLRDLAEHRRRVETRGPDLDGQRVPSWEEVVNREYVAWDVHRDGPCVRLDTTDTDLAVLTAVSGISGEHGIPVERR